MNEGGFSKIELKIERKAFQIAFESLDDFEEEEFGDVVLKKGFCKCLKRKLNSSQESKENRIISLFNKFVSLFQ